VLNLEKRRKVKHYNIPYHAHELTFSCYHRYDYLRDSYTCTILMEELNNARNKYNFSLWAYILMPNHVHILLFPKKEKYNISRILQEIKGRTSTRYRQWILESVPECFDNFCVISKSKKTFRLWQPGGGFDRNLWNAKAIHSAINYIEANPVRAGHVKTSENWPWSSARARMTKTGLVPDNFYVPVLMK